MAAVDPERTLVQARYDFRFAGMRTLVIKRELVCEPQKADAAIHSQLLVRGYLRGVKSGRSVVASSVP